MKQFLINLTNPKNWIDFVRGKSKKLFIYLSGQDKIQKAMYAVYICPECYVNNSCKECGCDFQAVILSNKQCPRHVGNKST